MEEFDHSRVNSINFAVHSAIGEYVYMLDEGDRMEEDAVMNLIAVFSLDSEVRVVAGSMERLWDPTVADIVSLSPLNR